MPQTKPTSEQVTFLQAGTGATQRTALAKLRDTVSVKDFGAVGDGVADDTAAFLAAIATIPLLSSITVASDGTPNAATAATIEIPNGLYKITQPLLFTNKAPCVIRGEGTTILNGSTPTVLLWYGTASQPMIQIDGGKGVCIDSVRLIGRAIAGYGVLFTRSDASYGRGGAVYDNLSITGCTIAGIQFGLADYANLDQTDQVMFNNTTIHGCYDGVVSVNRNNLNIQFNRLSIYPSYPPTGISPRQGVRILKGTIDVHGYYPGGFAGNEFSDYCIYLEDGYINVYGGYTETEKFIYATSATSSGYVTTSTIVGFDQYPATVTGGVGAINWDQAGNTLSWYGGRLAQNIIEGTNSGGVFVTNARFHNIPSWTGRTAKSACVNCNVIRTATPSESYQLNWIGKSASQSCIADSDYMISNNLQVRDSVMSRYVNTDSVALRMLNGELRMYHALAASGPTYNLSYGSFNEFFRSGFSSTDGKWMGNGTNRTKWAAAAPVAGTWVQGDVVWNTGVVAAGSPGWVCTSGGIPGTWKTMANVSA